MEKQETCHDGMEKGIQRLAVSKTDTRWEPVKLRDVRAGDHIRFANRDWVIVAKEDATRVERNGRMVWHVPVKRTYPLMPEF